MRLSDEYLNKYDLLDQLCRARFKLTYGYKLDSVISGVSVLQGQSDAKTAEKLKEMTSFRNELVRTANMSKDPAEMVGKIDGMLDVVLAQVLDLVKGEMLSDGFKKKYPQINCEEQFEIEKEHICNRFSRLVRVAELDAPKIIVDNETRMFKEAVMGPLDGKFYESE